MSFSVDDLVCSFSSSHIGQEALDLAALHAQLTQTLFSQPIASSSGDSSLDSFHQPCNTPTGRTPSSSFSWGQVLDVQQRLSRRSTDEMIDDAEDERMVEEILTASPTSAGYSAAPFALQQQFNNAPRAQSRSHHNRFTSPSTSSPISPGSLTDSSSQFASTDPFYLAQLQAMQSHNASPPSALSQLGKPAQHSPFVQQQQPRKETFSFSPSSISLDTHNLFAATSVAFEC
ncbi:hypothetical protein BDP27DRAFT_1380115 [Rhodocollybia butyracea]|uniref:Uncharacterized protein n=1 Tax=Rhodocollybia butyracea TaxID=206335 RepID=A0A9P5Q7L9_9AGAR|nr:hypothetical protein BDP27DRAFT_1380115 [Rhodocollybia butyracea]